MAAENDFLLIYAESDNGKRIDIIFEHYDNFLELADMSEGRLFEDIKEEKAFNRRETRGDLGIRVQTSGNYMKENGECKAYQIYALRDYMKEHESITKLELIKILNENAPRNETNKFQKITIPTTKLKEYFPTFYTKSQIENVLFQLLEDWKKENVDREG